MWTKNVPSQSPTREAGGSLQWEPRNNKKFLSTAMKTALRKRYGTPVNITMDADELPYLTGLLHAGLEEAQVLIDAIQAHREIDVKEV
jgi:hypothetical protein